MNNPIDIEVEFDRCIGNIGGLRVDKLPDASTNSANADYIFEDYEVIAELKCLQDNKLNDRELNKKLQKLHQKWTAQGYRIPITNDGFRATMQGLNQKQSREVLNVYAKPIKKVITKANKQIKETRKTLNKEHYKGVLLLANDGNYALDPEHIYHILSIAMRDSYSGINAVIFFTVNMPGNADFTNVDTLVWSNLNRPNIEPVENQFFEALQNTWMRHMELLTNSEIPGIILKNESDLSRIRNKQNA